MKKVFLILLLLIRVLTTYGKEITPSPNDLTIKELSKNIEKLKDENAQLKERNKELSKEHGELISFIKADLKEHEIDEIRKKAQTFIKERSQLQKKLKEKIDKLEDATEEKKNIIIHRVDFYKYIAKFVQKEKRQDFIDHVKFHIQSEKESKDLMEEILRNQNILEQKVSYIKGKIEDHKESLKNQIESEIISKIKERIDEIDNDPKYKGIDKKARNRIYQDFISLVKDKLKEVESSNLSENYKEIKKDVFKKMIEEIEAKIVD